MKLSTLKIGCVFRLMGRGPLLRVISVDAAHEEIDLEWPDGEGGMIVIRRFPASCMALPRPPGMAA